MSLTSAFDHAADGIFFLQRHSKIPLNSVFLCRFLTSYSHTVYQIPPTRVCFTNVGINNTLKFMQGGGKVSIISNFDQIRQS